MFEAEFRYQQERNSLSTHELIPRNLNRSTIIDHSFAVPIVDLIAWHHVNSQYRDALNYHGKYWWKTSGHALAILLDNARYSYISQVRILTFFARSIASKLGVAKQPGIQSWKSFMTDDHNPIELSWDWDTGHKSPSIRFSIECVGEKAGTIHDPHNELVAKGFTKTMLQELPTTNMEWFDHLNTYFSLGSQHSTADGHCSKMFWAFDLSETDISGKAYFFPEYRARAMQKTNIQVIREAIETAALCTSENLSSFYMFQEYANEQSDDPLEMDMLAIDLVEPSQSRFKIYFRSRDTSFESVRKAMTLGGRLVDADIDIGLRNLRGLWDDLFDQQGVSDKSPLPVSMHRTAGILYYVEFRLGEKIPKVKIYIPVRHYAKNDWQIMTAVSDFMNTAKADNYENFQLNSGGNTSCYATALSNILYVTP